MVKKIKAVQASRSAGEFDLSEPELTAYERKMQRLEKVKERQRGAELNQSSTES